jgi:ankyrin repeat protein
MPDSAFEGFQNAIADNNAGELKRLLDAGYDPNARFEENGLTPLHLAAWYNHPHLIELLIDHGAKVNQTEELTDKTPLHIAAYFGYLDCCRALIDKKAFTNQQDASYFTPLHYAALRGHLKVAQLFSHNIEDLSESSTCGTAIDLAIRHKNIEIIDYFLTKLEERFFPLNRNSKFFALSSFWKKATFPFMSDGPFYFATLVGAKEIIQLLLTKNYFQYTADSREYTPLHLAAWSAPRLNRTT